MKKVLVAKAGINLGRIPDAIVDFIEAIVQAVLDAIEAFLCAIGIDVTGGGCGS